MWCKSEDGKSVSGRSRAPLASSGITIQILKPFDRVYNSPQMVCGFGTFALVNSFQHPLMAPITTPVGGPLFVALHLLGAEHLFVARKVTTHILADNIGLFCLILEHV
jgi:hypothetical protein